MSILTDFRCHVYQATGNVPTDAELLHALRLAGWQSYDKGEGKWITIGAVQGGDGKKHGGTPVYVEGGRITKGHPSLTGKKIDALKEEGEPKELGPRQAAVAERERSRSRWAKMARKEGVNPKHLHQLAAEVLAHDKAFKADVTAMLQDARATAKAVGYGSLSNLSGAVESGDHAAIKGFDLLTRQMADRHPHVLGGYGYTTEEGLGEADPQQAAEKLMGYLQAGNPRPMDEDAAYDQALSHLISQKTAAEESVPFQRPLLPVFYDFQESKVHRGQPANRGQSGPGGGTGPAGGGNHNGVAHRSGGPPPRPSFQTKPPAGAMAEAFDAVTQLGQSASHLEHLAAAWVSSGVASNVARLPPKAQGVVYGVWAGVRGAFQGLFAVYTAGQALAEQVAIQNGATPEEAGRLRSTMAGIDLKTSKVFKFASLFGVHAAHLPTAVTGIFPVASTLYLASSSARNPVATARAARQLVRNLVQGAMGKVAGASAAGGMKLYQGEAEVDPAPLVELLRGIRGAGEAADWYCALVSAALDAVGSLPQAVQVASAAFGQVSSDPAAGERYFGYIRDQQGHEHKDKGPGGGQFAAQGDGSGGNVTTSVEELKEKGKAKRQAASEKGKAREQETGKPVAERVGKRVAEKVPSERQKKTRKVARTDKEAQDVAEGNEGRLATMLGKGHDPQPDNEPFDIYRHGSKQQDCMEVKSFLTNTTGHIKMNAFQKDRKNLYLEGKVLTPVSEAKLIPGEVPIHYTVDGRTTAYVIRNDPAFDPAKPRRGHVLVIDHRREWLAHQEGGQDIGERKLGEVYYQRDMKAWNKRDMIRADNPEALRKLKDMGADEFEVVAGKFKGLSYPSGSAHPPSPEMPKLDPNVKVYDTLLKSVEKHRARVDALANLGHRQTEYGQRIENLDHLRQRLLQEGGQDKKVDAIGRRMASLQQRLDKLPARRAKSEMSLEKRREKLNDRTAAWMKLPPAAAREATGKWAQLLAPEPEHKGRTESYQEYAQQVAAVPPVRLELAPGAIQLQAPLPGRVRRRVVRDEQGLIVEIVDEPME